MYITVPAKLDLQLVTWSAQHGASVEDVIREAIRTYIEDVDLRLLAPPRPAPGWLGKLPRRRD